ncbi:putative ribonuclease P/MRP protein subunit Pop1 [Plasmopara halstedii]
MTGLGPRVLQVLQFAHARAPELQALHELSQHDAVSSVTDIKLETQKNQRRRRANAFKSHKMPQRLRGTSSNNFRALRCRKHQRRPHKMLQERLNITDSERPRWLSTHLWHTKRMVMKEQYGYMLALHRSDKSISAALQAVRQTATLHDCSYYGIIELFGLPQVILEALQLISDPNGSDFHGQKFLAGAEEGMSMLHHVGQFPKGTIAPVTFMWRPLKKDYETGVFQLHDDWQNTKRQLWLWVHPAAYMEAATAIAAACHEVFESEKDRVEMHDRRGQLCRFKLRGRLANELTANLLAGDVEADNTEADDCDSDHEDGYDAKETVANCSSINRRSLLRALGKSSKTMKRKETIEHTNKVYAVASKDPRLAHFRDDKLKYVSSRMDPNLSLLKEPPAGAVAEAGTDVIKSPLSALSLSSLGKDADEPETQVILEEVQSLLAWTTNVSDSIVNFGSLVTSTQEDKDEVETVDSIPEESPCSMLWSLSKRHKLKSIFRKDHTLNDAIFCQRKDGNGRDGIFVSSAPLHLLAVKKCEPYPHMSGWDLICLPHCAPSVLKALVFGGALVVGIEEDSAQSTVLLQPSFPHDYPDTQAGKAIWDSRARNLETFEMKKPKAKRFNYEKHGVKSPYQPLWELLFEEDKITQVPCVLRGRDYMKPFCFYRVTSENLTDVISSELTIESVLPVPMPTLVRVSIFIPRRGNININAMLLTPSAEDMTQFCNDKMWMGYDIVSDTKNSKDSTKIERSLIGFVTSAVYDRPKGATRAIGFIACEPLQRLVIASQHYKFGRQGHYALAMLQSPQARMIRPVFIQAEP